MISAAKCHEYHEIFTNENNEHIRGSLMLVQRDTLTDKLSLMPAQALS